MFIVVAIVIFGIFVSLSYSLFGKTLQPQVVDLFTDATEQVSTTRGEKMPVYDFLMQHHAPNDTYIEKKGTITLTSEGELYLGIRTLPEMLLPNTNYVMSYKIKKVSGNINDLGGHLSVSDKTIVKLDGKIMGNSSSLGYRFIYPNDLEEHTVEVAYNTNNWNSETALSEPSLFRSFYIQPNREIWGKPYKADVSDIKLTKLN